MVKQDIETSSQSAATVHKKQCIRWGILGSGKIADQFAAQLVKLPDIELVGVASRTIENAQTFAERYQTKAFDSYQSLCDTSDADVIYVATPTRFHSQHCHLVLDANKSLLCEKPFTCNYAEALAVIQKAKDKQLFCMEAMWMRFNPFVRRAKEIIVEKKLGAVRTMHAELGYKKDLSTLGLASDGRGASLAFGCYLVSLAVYFFGKPNVVLSHLIANPQGGDETGSLLIQYFDNAVSGFYSEGVTLSNEVSIFLQNGCLKINSPFIDATDLEVVDLRELFARSFRERLLTKGASMLASIKAKILLDKASMKDVGAGFRLEAQEVNNCLRFNAIESDIMSWSETLLVHEILDAVINSREWRGN